MKMKTQLLQFFETHYFSTRIPTLCEDKEMGDVHTNRHDHNEGF